MFSPSLLAVSQKESLECSGVWWCLEPGELSANELDGEMKGRSCSFACMLHILLP